MEELDLLPHIPLDDGYFYEKLITLGLKKQETSLHFVPTFQGERFDPFMRGQMDHLDRKNWSLGDMSAAISKGLIENLFNMVPANLIPNIQQNR
jgi:sedoheptulokinase